jgi:phage terminase small subunit
VVTRTPPRFPRFSPRWGCGVRGRKPKPLHVREREGNPSKRPLPTVPRLAPLYELPEPPPDLSEAGRRAWEVVGGSLTDEGAMAPAFLPFLRMFAQACELAERAWGEMEESLVRPGRERGANPAVRVWRDAVATARALGEQLGASPAAMTRLGLSRVRGMSMAQELEARAKAKGEQDA